MVDVSPGGDSCPQTCLSVSIRAGDALLLHSSGTTLERVINKTLLVSYSFSENCIKEKTLYDEIIIMNFFYCFSHTGIFFLFVFLWVVEILFLKFI